MVLSGFKGCRISFLTTDTQGVYTVALGKEIIATGGEDGLVRGREEEGGLAGLVR